MTLWFDLIILDYLKKKVEAFNTNLTPIQKKGKTIDIKLLLKHELITRREIEAALSKEIEA